MEVDQKMITVMELIPWFNEVQRQNSMGQIQKLPSQIIYCLVKIYISIAILSKFGILTPSFQNIFFGRINRLCGFLTILLHLIDILQLDECLSILTDINECDNRRGGCQHDCRNTPGGYQCLCPAGYRLRADGRSCEGKTPDPQPLAQCWSVFTFNFNI